MGKAHTNKTERRNPEVDIHGCHKLFVFVAAYACEHVSCHELYNTLQLFVPIFHLPFLGRCAGRRDAEKKAA